MNKLYILYTVFSLTIIISIIVIVYLINKNNKNKNAGNKKLQEFIFNSLKEHMRRNTFDSNPSNLNMLDENIYTISSCISNVMLKILNKINIEPEKFILNKLTEEENKKFENIAIEYKDNITKCSMDNQIASIYLISDTIYSNNMSKASAENVINYIKANMKRNFCVSIENENCILSESDKKIVDAYKP